MPQANYYQTPNILRDVSFQPFSLPSWITNSKKWNQIYLGNVLLPGYAYLKESTLALRSEKNKSGGKDFGTVLIKGLEMPDFSFELILINKEHEDQWTELAPIFLPRKNPLDRGILPVYHPSLARYQIGNCVVVKLVETPPNAGGPMRVSIQCIGVSPVKDNASKSIKNKGAIGTSPVGQAPGFVNVSANVPSDNVHGYAKQAPIPNPGAR